MSEQLQLRRGSAAQVATFTGALGEVVVDTTNNRFVLQDGVTIGGFAAAKLSEVITNARTSIADANHAALPSERTIAYISLTAPRNVTLPAASTFPTGTLIRIVDESGACSASNTITLTASGSDSINGQVSAILASAYAFVAVESNGLNRWTIGAQSPDPTTICAVIASWIQTLPTTAPAASGVLWVNGGVLQLS